MRECYLNILFILINIQDDLSAEILRNRYVNEQL